MLTAANLVVTVMRFVAMRVWSLPALVGADRCRPTSRRRAGAGTGRHGRSHDRSRTPAKALARLVDGGWPEDTGGRPSPPPSSRSGDRVRPAIVTVDDDPSVSRAVARDLRRQYGAEHRIVRGESGEQTLEVLRELKLRGEQVAVLLADYRMPGMNGIEFLEQAMDVFPVRPPGAAHGVRRHRRRHRGHQRRRRGPLPAQAVGPAGGEALPGRRRAARRLGAASRAPAGAGDQGGRSPLVGAVLRGPRLPGPQPGALPLVHQPPSPRASGCWPPPACQDAGRGAGGHHHRRRGAARTRRRRARRPRGPGDGPHRGLLRRRGHRRRPRRAGRRGLRRLRGSAHGAGRADRHRRPGRAELAHRELPGLPRRHLRLPAGRAGPPPGGQVRRRGDQRPRRQRRRGRGRGPRGPLRRRRHRSPPTPRSWPPASPTGSSTPRAWTRWPGAACSTAPPLTEALSCADQDVYVVGRRQLGRPGGAVLRPALPGR